MKTFPISFDKSRKPDINNPKGYFELEGGKIINKLMEGIFPLELYKGEFIKITSYGLKYLPEGKYKIIYSERNIDEILDSMEKMTGEKDKDRFLKSSGCKIDDDGGAITANLNTATSESPRVESNEYWTN